MGVAAVAGPARYFLLAYREDSRARKVGIDLPDQHDHLTGDVLTRVQVKFLRLSPTVAIIAVHIERVPKLAHEGIGAVDVRVRRQQLETDPGPLLRRRISQRVAAVVELLRSG